MKKRTIALLTALTCTTAMVLSGCSLSSALRAADVINVEQSTENTATETPTATPEPTPTVTQLKLGEKAQVGDWTFKVKKVSTKKMFKISDYSGYKPTDGNIFVCLSVSVENKGSEEEKFLPMMGLENKMVTATLIYQDQYEYKPTDLSSYDKCLTNEEIKPLNKKSGLVVFDVPKEVSKNLDQATVKIGTVNENVVYPLKK